MTKNKILTIRVSQDEFDLINERIAADKNLKNVSDYIRKYCINADEKEIKIIEEKKITEVIEVKVETDDINELIDEIKLLKGKINSVCNTIDRTQKVYSQDVVKIKNNMSKIEDTLNEKMFMLFNNRKAIRDEAKKLLNKLEVNKVCQAKEEQSQN